MPTGATMVDGNASVRQAGNVSGKAAEPVATIPFTRASFQHVEPFQPFQSAALGANSQNPGIIEIPSYGYMRSIVLKVTATGGSGGSAVFSEDGPFNVLQEIILSEPNGASIAQFYNGWQLYLANKYGGFNGFNDPRRTLTTDADGNFSFLLRIPVELSARDALGALPNQNAASSFQLRYQLAPSATVYSTPPVTTLPTVLVEPYLEAWAQPAGQNPNGGVNQTTPPAMNTTQYHSMQQYTVVQGDNRIRLNRVGNYIRNLTFIFTRSGGTRANGDADFPVSDAKLWLDSTPIDMNLAKTIWQQRVYDRYGYYGTPETAGARDYGVYPYDFCHDFDGKVGFELRDQWLLTNTSSRLEFQGTFANAGTLRVLTNDVSTAGQVFL